jgi:hypothetical protein
VGWLRTRTRPVGRFDYRVILPPDVEEDQVAKAVGIGTVASGDGSSGCHARCMRAARRIASSVPSSAFAGFRFPQEVITWAVLAQGRSDLRVLGPPRCPRRVWGVGDGAAGLT